MHPNFQRAHICSAEVIGAAIEVHREKGPGLLESIYQKCLWRELTLRQIPSVRELVVPVAYKGLVFDETLRVDLLVDGCLLVETKAVEAITRVHVAQLLSYMRLLDVPVELLINFHEPILRQGLRRLTLRGADQV